MFSLLIFDLDGTLIDSRKDIAQSVNLTFRDLGLPPLPNETIYGYVGNGVIRLIKDSIGSNDPDFIRRAIKIFEGHYLTHLLNETRLYPGIEEVLIKYDKKRKALVTNKHARFTRKIIEGLGVSNRFEYLLGGDEVAQMKPHPEMILKTLDRLNVHAEETVMIGDMLNDIYAARAAGIKICSVGYGFGEAQELKAAQPDFFVETADDLKTLFP